MSGDLTVVLSSFMCNSTKRTYSSIQNCTNIILSGVGTDGKYAAPENSFQNGNIKSDFKFYVK